MVAVGVAQLLSDPHPQRQLRIALGELGFFLGGDFARIFQLEIGRRERRLYRQLLQLVQAFVTAVEIPIDRAHVLVDILPRFRIRDAALARVQGSRAKLRQYVAPAIVRPEPKTTGATPRKVV